jgi:Neurotransmitter-gated ion-channel ligand binding domain
LRQAWNDPRLTWSLKPPHEHMDKIKLETDMWKQIWIPDTFFRNEKRANFHEVTVSNRMLRLSNNGDLFYVTK